MANSLQGKRGECPQFSRQSGAAGRACHSDGRLMIPCGARDGGAERERGSEEKTENEKISATTNL
jgi:hypothetical protein